MIKLVRLIKLTVILDDNKKTKYSFETYNDNGNMVYKINDGNSYRIVSKEEGNRIFKELVNTGRNNNFCIMNKIL